MKVFQRIFILVFLMLWGLSSLFPQSYTSLKEEIDRIKRDFSFFRIGPFRIQPRLSLQSIGYDDNINRQPAGEDVIRDYWASLIPEVQVHVVHHDRLILSFTESPQVLFYFRTKEKRLFNNSWSSEARVKIFRRFVLSGHYQRGKRTHLETSEFDILVDSEAENIGASLYYETPRQTAIGVAGDIRRLSYFDLVLPGGEAPLSSLLDREERTGSFRVHFRIFSRSQFFLNTGYSEYKFQNVESSGKNGKSYQMVAGIDFPVLGRLEGIFSLGYKAFKPNIEGRKDFAGLIGNTSLMYRLERFVLRARFSRDIFFSYYEKNTFFIENQVGAGLYYYITRSIRLETNVNFGRNDYIENELVEYPDGTSREMIRRDRFQIYTVGLSVRLVRNIGFGLRASRWERNSNIPRWDNRRNIFIGGFLSYDF